jgi:hypothetical protein
MTVGPRRLQSALFGVVNLRSLYGNLSGILGADTLSTLGFVRIDYHQLTMTMGLAEPPSAGTTRGTTRVVSVPKRFRAGTDAVAPMRVFRVGSSSDPAPQVASAVPVSISGHRYQFHVDTGAAITALSPAVLRASSAKTQPGIALSLGGCRQSATPARLTGWQLAGEPLPATRVVATSLPSDIQGLLGADVFVQRNPIVLDYTDGSLLTGGRGTP